MSIKALLIDPHTQTVTDVTVGNGRGVLHALYDLLGCSHVDAVVFSDAVSVLYCDDAGRLKDQPGFMIVELTNHVIRHTLVAGKAVLFGPIDDDGNDTDTTWTATTALAEIEWVVDMPGPD